MGQPLKITADEQDLLLSLANLPDPLRLKLSFGAMRSDAVVELVHVGPTIT